ncbi:MAG: hypothetical protein WCC59_18775 [Terriglobales bacterium]
MNTSRKLFARQSTNMRSTTASRGLMVLLLAVLASVAPLAAAAQTTFNYPGAAATGASNINDSGTIVGYYYNSDGSEHSFLYDGHGFTSFDYPGADWTEASGINQAGDVVGYYGYAADKLMHGFLRTAAGKFSTIDRQGRFNTMPLAINSSGAIVGCIHNPGTMHGWLMENGAFVSLSPAYAMYTGINDAGTIVGWNYAAPGRIRSFLLSGAGRVEFDYPGTNNTQAYGVNAYGAVVGWYGPDASGHGFLLRDGQFTPIDVSGATLTRAFGINSAGMIVGYYSDATGYHGFVQ